MSAWSSFQKRSRLLASGVGAAVVVTTVFWVARNSVLRSTSPSIGDLAARYRSAQTARERTQVLFGAIDAGLVRDSWRLGSTKIGVVEQIVSGDTPLAHRDGPWADRDRAPGTESRTWSVVDLNHALREAPASLTDWYFVVRLYPGDDAISTFAFCNCWYDPNVRELWRPREERARPVPDIYENAPASSPGPEDAGARVAQLRNRVWSAKTQYERRDVALDAIEEGLIGEGRSIAVVDRIFGTSCDRAPRAGELANCEVEFLPYHRRSAEGYKSGESPRPWALFVNYNATGRIVCFAFVLVSKGD